MSKDGPPNIRRRLKKRDWQASVNKKERNSLRVARRNRLPASDAQHFVPNRRHGARRRLVLTIRSSPHEATPSRRRRKTLAILNTLAGLTISLLISGSAEASPARLQGQR
jgi:hypothetical protein